MIFSLGPPSNALVTRVSPSWKRKVEVAEFVRHFHHSNLVSHSKLKIRNDPEHLKYKCGSCKAVK